MKKLYVLLALILVLAFSAMAMAEGVVGSTLKVNGSSCVVTFVQGAFGCGDGCQTGPAELKCGTDTLSMVFMYQSPDDLKIYSSDFSAEIDFALVNGAFKQLVPGGVELME